MTRPETSRARSRPTRWPVGEIHERRDGSCLGDLLRRLRLSCLLRAILAPLAPRLRAGRHAIGLRTALAPSSTWVGLLKRSRARRLLAIRLWRRMLGSRL